MGKISELKEMIVDLRVELLQARIPNGNCPYAYYSMEKDTDCNEISCDECQSNFFEKYAEEVRKEVRSL